MIYYVRMRTRTRPLRRFRFAVRFPRGSRQVTLSPVPDPLCVQNILRRILARIATLDEMPERFRSYPREPLSSQGVRVMDVGNYCVYYRAKDGVVSIGRVLYFRRDADAIFAQGWQ